MASDIVKKILFEFQTVSKGIASDTSTSGSIKKKTKASIAEDVSEALSVENLTTGFTRSVMAVLLASSSIVKALTIIVPLVFWGAMLAIPVFGKLLQRVGEMFEKPENTSAKELSNVGDLFGKIQDETRDISNNITSTPSKTNESLASTSPVSNVAPEEKSISDVNVNLATNAAPLETPITPKMEDINQKVSVEPDIETKSYEDKVTFLNGLNMSKGVEDLTKALTNSMHTEKEQMLSLFPIYESFSSLLSKIVAQLEVIQNPSLDAIKSIGTRTNELTSNMYGYDASTVQQARDDLKNYKTEGSGSNSYFVYTAPQITTNNP